MKKANFTMLIKAIKSFLKKSNGIMLIHEHKFHIDISDYYDEVTKDFEMKKISEDKKSMKMDNDNLKKDIKKSIADYHSDLVN